MAKATRDGDDEPTAPVDGADDSRDSDDTSDTSDSTDTVSSPGSPDPVETGATATGTKKSGAKKADARKSGGAPTRRQRLAQMEAKRKAEQRRRTLILLTICLVAAISLLAYPVYLFVDDVRLRNTPRDQIGVSADQAGCLPVETNTATGNQQHEADGTVVQYARLPPDSGAHWNTPAPFDTKFYSTGDRPAVETLVHNLEHGYVVIWYRSTLPAAEVKEIQAITKTYSGTTLQDKVIAAPWDPAVDGGDFPAGTNITLARWTADPAAPADTAKQRGVRLSCARISGAVVAKFRTDYPTENSPEPNGA